MSSIESIRETVLSAVAARVAELDAAHEGAWRLFNGYSEGAPGLVIELFGQSLVLFTHEKLEGVTRDSIGELASSVAAGLPFVRTTLWKHRSPQESGSGVLLQGQPGELERKLREHGVRYALDLMLHREASFYLDTRELRAWLKSEAAGQSVLNAFAYTGSLGVAAAAGGARSVLHVDVNRAYLNLAKASYALNGLPVRRGDFVAQDFMIVSAGLRKKEQLYDWVIIDAPFFASSGAGRVDLVADAERLLNKARPLVGHGGRLVFVNNALFVSGAEQNQLLERVCADGYLELERTVPVPADVVGLVRAADAAWPADPSPYNYPTKIAVLRVRRKDGRTASPEGG